MTGSGNHRPGFVLALLVAVAVACMGCATGATPARKAFVSISDADAAVKAAMGAFNDRYQAGLQTEADRTKVLTGYAVYQTTANAAVTLAKDVTQQANALTVATDAANAVLALIAQLIPVKTSGLWFLEVSYV